MEDEISKALGSLPRGFRFNPTDQELLELLNHYLECGEDDIIPVIEACKLEPKQFEEWPAKYGHMFKSKDLFYFCDLKEYKYSNSKRCYDRKTIGNDGKTISGHWRVTSADRRIMSEDTNVEIGIMKTLVFHPSKSVKKESSNWVCHEYHLNHNKYKKPKHYVICRIKNKKEKKPKTAHAPAISPVGCPSRPHAYTSNVSGTPVNQEGDHSSFRNTRNSGVAGNQEAVNAQPETSAEDTLAYDILANSAGYRSLFEADFLNDDWYSDPANPPRFYTSTDHYITENPYSPGWESGTV